MRRVAAPGRIERATDLIRSVVVPVLASLVVLAAVVVAAAVQDGAVQRASGVMRVDAVVLERPDGRPSVPVVWPVAGGGGTRTGVVPAPAGAAVGDTVPLWVDRSGVPVRPRDLTGARTRGVLSGAVVLGAGAVSLLLVYVGAGRVRRRYLSAEWAVVEPRWSGRAAG